MLTMRSVKVKGRSKDYIAHPWIFRDKVADAGDAQPGENVLVFTTKGAFIGSAIYNPKSKITLRFYSRAREELDYIGLKFRLMQADQVRQTLLPGETSYRMAFGESDDLPGLIIDRYENGFVIQILSLGMEIRRNAVLNALIDAFEPQFVYERSDSMLRIEEGLNQRSGLLYGELPEELIITSAGVKYHVDVAHGQKTGFFFDQRENRLALERYAKGVKRALDLFSYTGGFTLHLLKGGAKVVYAVDRSRPAIELLKQNVELNGYSSQRVLTFVKDVFEFLEEMSLAGEKFDLIVIDPPSFAKKRKDIGEALGAYRTLHEKAIALLNDGGYIATFSCARYISEADLIGSFYVAARRLGKSFYLVEHLHQAKDHPVLVGFPESEYLKGVLLKHKFSPSD